MPRFETELKQTILAEIETMRLKLKDKSIAEGRSAKAYSLLEGFENSIIGDLLFEVRSSGKDPIQAMLLFFTAIEFHSRENPLELSLEQLAKYTEENYFDIKQLMIENTLSKNIGQRALSILLMLAESEVEGHFNAIELGASAGLIGRALMNSERFVEQIATLADISEQFAAYASEVFGKNGVPVFDSYLGVDIKLSNLLWNYYCIREPTLRIQYEQFIQEFSDSTPKQTLIERSALGFSEIDGIAELENPVVITSMMLYQLPAELTEQLTNEIISFLSSNPGYWINLFYSEENNCFEGTITKVGETVTELKKVTFLKGEGIEWDIAGNTAQCIDEQVSEI